MIDLREWTVKLQSVGLPVESMGCYREPQTGKPLLAVQYIGKHLDNDQSRLVRSLGLRVLRFDGIQYHYEIDETSIRKIKL